MVEMEFLLFHSFPEYSVKKLYVMTLFVSYATKLTL